MKKQVKQTVEGIMSEIIDEAYKKLDFDDNKYVCICLFDYGSGWQVWLNWGMSGKKANGEVLVNGDELYWGKTNTSLIKTLRTFLELVQEKRIEAVK